MQSPLARPGDLHILEHSTDRARPAAISPTSVDAEQIAAWNDTTASYPAACLSELFEAQVARSPGATAALCRDERLTYQDLNARANQLAHRLIASGASRRTLVGVCLERSLDMLIAVLGILKAGAAYVPLDPSYPRAHLGLMLDDTFAPIVITHERVSDRLPEYTGTSVRVDVRHASVSDANPDVRTRPDEAAYVIYTSGSTGRPKGVVGLHRGVVNRCAWMWNRYPFAPGEVCCQKTSLNFVDSVAEIFAPLLQGVPTVIVPDGTSRDVLKLIDALEAGCVSRLVLVPSLLRDLLDVPDLDRRLAALRLCVSSGEALTTALCRRFHEQLPHAVLINLYGSTEVSADVTCYETNAADRERANIPIGRPIANTRIRLLDDRLQLVPIGTPGELYVGGAGLAGGYLNRPDLTVSRFVPDPWSTDPGARLYKTGDRARYLADGNIEFLGRIDHQVKIRGFRIEPGDIEAALIAHPDVRQAVVIGHQDNAADTRLVAYVVPRDADARNASPAAADLRRFCRTRLPEAMVPSAFVLLDRLPLTPSGKVNRGALPPSCPASASTNSESGGPRTRIEERLAACWREVLGLEHVGVHDDFFDLGGHSLAAARLFTRIERMFGRSLPLDTLFEAPTIEDLGEILSRTSAPAPAWSPVVPLQPRGLRPPLFLVHGIGGEVMSFAALAQHLGPDQPVYGIRARGSDGVREPLPDVESMAGSYIEAIRGIEPEGPYCLAGYSAGGPVALEMAQQLRASGLAVGALIVIDSPDLKAADDPPSWRLGHVPPVLRNLAYWVVDNEVLRRGRSDVRAHLRFRARTARAQVLARFRSTKTEADIRDVLGLWRVPDRQRRFLEVHHRAMTAYVARPYLGSMTLIRARTMPLFAPPERDLGWSRVAHGSLEIRIIRGAHDNILREPRVRALAQAIKELLCDEIQNSKCKMQNEHAF